MFPPKPADAQQRLELLMGRPLNEGDGLQASQLVDSREQVFGVAAEQIRDDEVLYMEFGAYRGTSMRFWSHL
jgi:hypothetical protein